MLDILSSRAETPRIEHVRLVTKLRTLQVGHVAQLTPGMLRITFVGDDLADFTSPAFDDNVKILIPSLTGDSERRNYTPRKFDQRGRTLAIDFAIHEAGPATRWALEARPGDKLQIGGPKGSAVVSAEIRRWVLIGDETALPAIGRRIEEAEAGTHITCAAAVSGPQEHQAFETGAELKMLWAHRPLSAGDDPSALLAILQNIVVQPETIVWIAAEAKVARAIRTYVVEELGHPLSWTKASGYWVMGRPDATEKFA